VSAQSKIPDDQVAWARHIVNRRREVTRQLKRMPTLDDLAEILGCNKRYLQKIISNKVRMVPRQTVLVVSRETK
jgi:AraC-like DNA-binding protein